MVVSGADKLHYQYLDNHAHSNWQERVTLKNGGRHSLNLVWEYTSTLPPFSGRKVCEGTLFPAYYIQAAKNAGGILVHSFLPIVKGAAKSVGVASTLFSPALFPAYCIQAAERWSQPEMTSSDSMIYGVTTI